MPGFLARVTLLLTALGPFLTLLCPLGSAVTCKPHTAFSFTCVCLWLVLWLKARVSFQKVLSGPLAGLATRAALCCLNLLMNFLLLSRPHLLISQLICSAYKAHQQLSRFVMRIRLPCFPLLALGGPSLVQHLLLDQQFLCSCIGLGHGCSSRIFKAGTVCNLF